MALDPTRWTTKTREAFQDATTQAAAAGNPYVTPAHLLLALLNQPEGIARPLLVAANLDPISVATALNPHIGYDRASEIVKEASASGRSLREVAREAGVEESVLEQALDYRALARPHAES